VEVFIAYKESSLVDDLKNTLEAWEKVPDVQPIAIQAPEKKYEIIRRVTAENISTSDYILCDLGCVPCEDDPVSIIKQVMAGDEKIGMIRFSPESGVRFCRKGIVEKWPKRESINYQHEHEMAYLLEGYQVPKCPTLSYRRLGVH
jgi:hypothetical protein